MWEIKFLIHELLENKFNSYQLSPYLILWAHRILTPYAQDPNSHLQGKQEQNEGGCTDISIQNRGNIPALHPPPTEKNG